MGLHIAPRVAVSELQNQSQTQYCIPARLQTATEGQPWCRTNKCVCVFCLVWFLQEQTPNTHFNYSLPRHRLLGTDLLFNATYAHQRCQSALLWLLNTNPDPITHRRLSPQQPCPTAGLLPHACCCCRAYPTSTLKRLRCSETKHSSYEAHPSFCEACRYAVFPAYLHNLRTCDVQCVSCNYIHRVWTPMHSRLRHGCPPPPIARVQPSCPMHSIPKIPTQQHGHRHSTILLYLIQPTLLHVMVRSSCASSEHMRRPLAVGGPLVFSRTLHTCRKTIA